MRLRRARFALGLTPIALLLAVAWAWTSRPSEAADSRTAYTRTISDTEARDVLSGLPSDEALGYPAYGSGRNVSVVVELDGQIPASSNAATNRISPFVLTGAGGTPQEVLDGGTWSLQEGLLERPPHAVVRIRAKRNTGFVAGQVIGSVQFDFHYNISGYSDCVSSVLAARARTEARGIAMVGAPSFGVQRATLISPGGFQLTFISDGLYDASLAGEGPFLDLMVQKGTGACDLSAPGWFRIENLIVTDVDGQELINTPDPPLDSPQDPDQTGTAVLRTYLIDPT